MVMAVMAMQRHVSQLTRRLDAGQTQTDARSNGFLHE
jgi:hypothetical protein